MSLRNYFLSVFAFLSLQFQATENSSLSIGFIENKGQILDQNRNYNKDVLFLYSGKQLSVQLKRNGFSYQIQSLQNSPPLNPEKKFMLDPLDLKETRILISRVDVEFENGSKNFSVETGKRKNAFSNHIVDGKEFYDIASYEQITYKDIYPHIDIVFKIGTGHEQDFKYDLILNPGADLSQVKFLIAGAENISLTNNKLSIRTALGSITENIPMSYYSENPLNKYSRSLSINRERTLIQCSL